MSHFQRLVVFGNLSISAIVLTTAFARSLIPIPCPCILSSVHPVLFHIGAMVVPTYGAVTALGVLLALALVLRTARIAGVDTAKVWNLSMLSLFAALIAARLLLVAANWSALRLHPAWLLGIAMVHHPLLAGTGALAGSACALWYARRAKLPLAATADALAPPLALGLAFEQLGALAAGSGYGRDAGSGLRWAVTYTDPMAMIWSGTPLGVPLHPVQAYAALAFLALALLLFVWLPAARRTGDVAGLGLMGVGVAVYITEFWRDPEGRGAIFGGALDGPQIAAIVLVIAGALVLRERTRVGLSGGPQRRKATADPSTTPLAKSANGSAQDDILRFGSSCEPPDGAA
ncbi:MAG: prolipoprotein diacylglyceryl transferase family protein [Terracidiphilus sp.]